LAQRAQEASDYQVPEWAKVNDTAIENLAKQYADDYDDEADEFYCVPCKKAFKSEKQWVLLLSAVV